MRIRIVCGVALMVIACTKAPKDAVTDFVARARQGDAAGLIPLLTSQSATKIFDGAGTPPDQRGAYIGRLLKNNPFWKRLASVSVASESVSGDTATVTCKSSTGDDLSVPLAKEDGRWHINVIPIVKPLDRAEREQRAKEARQNVGILYRGSIAMFESAYDRFNMEKKVKSFGHSLSLTPDRSFCSDEDGIRAKSEDWKPWEELSFDPADYPEKGATRHYYRYEYVSSGTGAESSFTARAIGDLDCDGVYSTFERSGSVRNENGDLNVKGQPPDAPGGDFGSRIRALKELE